MMKKIRLLHCHPSEAMAAIFVMPLIESERSQGYESRLITSSGSAEPAGGITLPFDLNFKNLFFLPFTFIRLCIFLAFYRPSLLVSHNFKSSLLPLLAARVLKIPSRIYFNHGVPYLAYGGWKRKLFKLIEAVNMRLATEVLTVSQDMVLALSEVYKNRKLSLIANGSACGLDLSGYGKAHYDRQEFCDAYEVSFKDHIIAYVGRPERRKGFLVALDIWLRFFQDQDDFKLFLCGPTEVDVLNALGLIPKNIHCLGFVNCIPEVLANSDYLILPSFHEGLSYAVLEAMASECIVIANDIDGIRNIIEDGVNGFLVENNAVEKYFDLVLFIQNQSEEFRRKIRVAGAETSEKFSRDLFLDSYQNYLEDILLRDSVKL